MNSRFAFNYGVSQFYTYRHFFSYFQKLSRQAVRFLRISFSQILRISETLQWHKVCRFKANFSFCFRAYLLNPRKS